MKKICVVTGSRAEYGLLSGLIRLIDADEDLQLQIIATNMHLSPEFGLTYKEIENDGFRIDKKVDMLLSSDTSGGTVKSVGVGLIGFADAYEALKPDLLLVLGDRYEILAAVSAALFYRIPVAHLHGGELTEGAYDDSLRHAITKMSHLHFTSTETYRKRVIQLGEHPDRVFNVGALGVENIKKVPLLSKEELEKELSFPLGDKFLLVTYHPVTLENDTAEEQVRNLLEALAGYPDYRIVFTLPNSDTNSRAIFPLIEGFARKNKERCVVYKSMGLRRYLSALKYSTAVVGNSSSGILEAPGFGVPTLDIGRRQAGRTAAGSVIHCGSFREDIQKGLAKILSDEFRRFSRQVENPYEKPGTASNILHILKDYPFDTLIQKHFYDW